MELRSRSRDDLAFMLAFAAISAAGLAFAANRNGAAAVMCMICLAGVVGGRIVGIGDRVLLAVTAGLIVLLWLAWIDPPASSRKTSAIAHLGGGLLVGGALAATLRSRLRWPDWGIVALLVVGATTVAWELAEYAGDTVFSTALQPNGRDSAEDIFFGCLGGAAAIAVAGLVARWRDPNGSSARSSASASRRLER